MKGAAKLLFSPERIIGLADCLGGNSRIRSFGLGEALYHSYVNDLRFVLFVCLILGFSWWSQYWPNIPGEWFVQQPEIVVNPQLVHTYKEALSCFKSYSSNMALEAQCPHAGCVHDRVLNSLIDPVPIDPLELKPSPGMKALATAIGVIVIVMALGESVTPDGILL